MLSHHVLAVLCNKNLEIAGSSWLKGKIRFLLSCQQRGEVLFHESQVFHEVEASLFEVVEFFKEALAKHGELFSVYGRYKHKGRTILHWLMSKSPEDFHYSFILPSWAQQPSGFGNFLKTIGFVPVEM